MTAGCSKFPRMKEYVYFGPSVIVHFFTGGLYYVVEGENYDVAL